jgi:hypothetical protein
MEHRHGQHAAKAGSPNQRVRIVFGIPLDVRDVHDGTLQDRPAGEQAASGAGREELSRRLERLERVVKISHHVDYNS